VRRRARRVNLHSPEVSRTLAHALVTVAAAFLLAGCNTVRVSEPLTRKFGGNAPAEQLAFWHALPERPVSCKR